MSEPTISDELFKEAMSCFASGVTIVTMVDNEGKQWGFTAASFSSLSLSPPMVLICLSRFADCIHAFNQTSRFGVSILGSKHEQLALTFAKKGIDKFHSGEFVTGQSGVPILPDALVSLECKRNNLFSGGDHIILTGLVNGIKVGSCDPSIWYKGKFHTLVANTNPT